MDALSFLGSALFLGRIRPVEPPVAERGRGALTAGARYIRESSIARASLLSVATINLFNFMFGALFVLYAARTLHIHAALLGLVLGAGAVGGVIGSVVTRRLAGAIGVGWAYLGGCILYTVPLLLVPLAHGPTPLILGLLFASEFVSGFGVMVLDISIGAIFAAVVPDQLRSRVAGAFQAVNYGTRPVGSLIGGALGATLGVRPTLWIGAAGAVAGFLWLLPSALPRFRMPGPAGVEPAEAEPAA